MPVARARICAAPSRWPLALLALAAVLGAWLAAAPAHAQDGAASAAASAPDSPLIALEEQLPQSPVELVSRSGETEAELKRIEEDAAIPPRLAEIEKELDERGEPLRKRARRWVSLARSAHNDGQMIDIIYLWSHERSRLTPLADELFTISNDYEKAHLRLNELYEIWSKANAKVNSDAGSEVPGEVRERINSILGSIRATRLLVSNRRARVVRSTAKVVDLTRHVDDVIAAARLARPTLGGATETRDGPPLWRLPQASDARWRTRLSTTYERNYLLSKDFFTHHGNGLLLNLLFFVMIVLAIAHLHRATETADEAARASIAPGTAGHLVLSRRYPSAALLATLATPLFHHSAPTAVLLLWGALSIAAALPLIPKVIPRRLRPISYVALGLFGLVMARYLVQGSGTATRILHVLTLILAMVLYGSVLRKLRLQNPRARLARWLSSATVVGLIAAVLSAALVASVLGYLELAYILGDTIIRGAHYAVILYAGYRVLVALLDVACVGEPLSRLAVVRNHQQEVMSRLRSTIGLATTVLWLWLVLDLLTIQTASYEWLRDLLREQLSVGSLRVTLGSILLLVVGIFVAIIGSRIVRHLLTEDVLPRTPLARGAQYAVAVSVSYLTLVIVFVGTLAAVGFQLSQFAFIVGALGVGIGFGLQNVVNNFVSGLILLFGRPLEIGHTIEVGGKLGEVTRIGFRSSTLRTISGAEVILPNADLVSGQVVNWTLSDALRRLEIDVGIAYGSDVERAMNVLRDMAEQHPDVLVRPKPDVLFMGFGDSSLDLKLISWIRYRHYTDYISIRSQLTLAVNNALTEADIEIPFPQRDLHLRSVDTPATAALSKLRSKGEHAASEEREEG